MDSTAYRVLWYDQVTGAWTYSTPYSLDNRSQVDDEIMRLERDSGYDRTLRLRLETTNISDLT